MSDLLNKASLVMVPSGYKEDTVYSVIPTDGSGDLSFTRASNGTRVNSAGLVEVAPWNLVEYSEDFSNAIWSKSGGTTVTANSTTAPNGTTTADTLDDQNSGAFGSIQQTFVFVAGVYTYSIYIKKTSGSLTHYPGLEMCSKGTYLIFNTTTGTYVEEGGSNYTVNVANVGDYWRVSITTTTSGGSQNLGVWPAISSNGSSISSSATGSNVFWGAQLNIGSTAKPYFPTTDRLNVPRLTYQNGGGGCPSLLLEKQSTNLVYPSEDFTNANYSGANNTITANDAISPDGTQNADKFTTVPNTGENYLRFGSFSILGNIGSSYTLSIFAKKGTANFLRMRNLFVQYGDDFGNAWFNLNTGAVGTVESSQTASIQNMGNGWYRCTLTGVVGSSNNYNFIDIGFTDTDATKYPSTSVNGYIWGEQLEASSYATSYIPTTSSSATRVADACSKTGISSLIGQSEGTIFVEVDILNINPANVSRIILSDGTTNNYIFLGINEAGSGNLSRLFINNTTASFTLSLFSSTAITVGRHKLALAYKSGSFALYLDGNSVASSATTGTIPTCSQLVIGGVSPSSVSNLETFTLFQNILFPTRLTNAELASLTTL